MTREQKMTALEHRNTVIAKIMAQYDAETDSSVLPVVSLEDFFQHNWDEYSLAPNIVDEGRPTLSECYEILNAIKQRPEVQDVLVAIHECPYADDQEDNDIWPDSDTVYILTSATNEQVAEWSARLMPTEIGTEWSCNTGKKPAAAPEPLPSMRVVALWWD